MSIAVILGAGFSKCATLPTQDEFPNYLLSEDLSTTPLDKSVTNIIQNFLENAFGWRIGQKFPSLEDYFTCLDLSANVGHNLGRQYPPQKLRAIRRITIFRIFQILDYKYQRSEAINKFIKHCLRQNIKGFIVSNWDIVLESVLADLDQHKRIYYGFESYSWMNHQRKFATGNDLIVSKINGSSNWVYCETCHKIFYDLYHKLALYQRVGIKKSDFLLFRKLLARDVLDEINFNHICRECLNPTLASHIATFSFKKSYRTFAYPVIWHNSHKILLESDKWIFVGYSLPDADYEFKHLIKSAELSYKSIDETDFPKITVILKDDLNAQKRYQKLFGNHLPDSNIHQQGLEEFVSRNLS